MARKPAVSVHIVLDTNSLFTEAADKLIAQELSEYILDRAESAELSVTWHLPDVVRAERKHQMAIRAKRLLPHLAKVESLLGHAFGISAELLVERVDAVIEREVNRHNLKLRNIDPSTVDWHAIISQSVQRLPPFDPGENEKGFRDAIVLETFCSIVGDLPKNPGSCRIIFMTGDGVLAEAAKIRTNDRNNVSFIGDLEAIKTMLNTLVSTLTQETVSRILPLASKIFFVQKDESTLFYKEDIDGRINKKFQKEIRQTPDPSFTEQRPKQTLIGPPSFLSKTGQRVRFSSRVTYVVEVSKIELRPSPVIEGLIGLGLSGPSLLSNAPSSPSITGLLGSNPNPGLGLNPGGQMTGFGPAVNLGGIGSTRSLGSGASPTLVNQYVPFTETRTGQHVFEVEWSASLSAKGNLTRPKIETVEYKSTTWKDTI